MKLKLEDELRKTTDVANSALTSASEVALARKKAENRVLGLTGGLQSERIRQEMARYATMRDPRLR